MPAELRDLQARRRAARAGRRRRTAAAALLGLVASGALAFALLGGGSGGGEAEPSSVPSIAPPALPGTTPEELRELVGFGTAAPRPLSPRELAGQRLIAGYDGLRPPRGLRRMIRRGQLAGVILFDDNVAGRRETARRIASLQRIRRPRGLRMPLAVMVDQEGGLVKRLPGPPRASAEEMGRRGAAYARRQGAATASSLRSAGINVDLAPVLDVARPGSAIASEERSFGPRAARVIAVGVGGFARGLRDGGIAATAKHFPGLGAARTNTDDASQRIALSRRRLRGIDERPFGSFIGAGGKLVMLGLATYPAFSDRPAALSRTLATAELRDRLGFDGVSISDSLDAAAARSFGGRRRVARETAQAGTDLLLYGNWRVARLAGEVLRHGVASGRLSRAGFERSVSRVLALRRGLSD